MNSQNIQLPELKDVMGPEDALLGDSRGKLEAVLPGYIQACRWFGAKARQIQSAEIREIIPVGDTPTKAFITMVRIRYADKGSETYVLPFASAPGDPAFTPEFYSDQDLRFLHQSMENLAAGSFDFSDND